MRHEKPMVIECDTCPVRHVRCDDCLVTALQSLSAGPGPATTSFPSRTPGSTRTALPVPRWNDGDRLGPHDVDRRPDRAAEASHDVVVELSLDAAEQRAVARFVAAGLVSAHDAAVVTARREPWNARVSGASGVAAVG